MGVDVAVAVAVGLGVGVGVGGCCVTYTMPARTLARTNAHSQTYAHMYAAHLPRRL